MSDNIGCNYEPLHLHREDLPHRHLTLRDRAAGYHAGARRREPRSRVRTLCRRDNPQHAHAGRVHEASAHLADGSDPARRSRRRGLDRSLARGHDQVATSARSRPILRGPCSSDPPRPSNSTAPRLRRGASSSSGWSRSARRRRGNCAWSTLSSASRKMAAARAKKK